MNVSQMMGKVSEYCVKKPLDAFAKTKFADKGSTKYQLGNAKYIAALGITSIALKDGLGCYMYVNQSLHNKNIPEDKRKFVAALDLTNGGLMILAQVLMFFTISNSKVQEKMFGKLFGKFFDGPAKKVCQAAIKKSEKFKDITPKAFDSTFGKFKKDIQGFFGIFTGIVGATILAKRVIVPFIATPLADKAKGLLYKDEKKNVNVIKDNDTFTHTTEKK